MRRVFIAINLPDRVKEELLSHKAEIPAKWTKKENLHITLNFLGNITEERLGQVLKLTEDVCRKHAPFYVRIKRIEYSPQKPPRMVWASGSSPELSRLKQGLDKALDSFDNRKYSLHITLARIKVWDFKRMDPEDIPEIAEEVDIGFEADSVEVMDSVLKKAGPEYTVLQAYNL